ncbi:glycosyltransferase family 39 protein [Shewanella sp. NIFS-20-20]|uniref:ArnT family glycosyltransferase n=1 Tax=Shewanella sp. NIFS-20-20 TaxID=2853806 RepID=UPI001C46184E|nr:glycosyltransferase family 39 protein [Shewanella sp. NIFS-20-20]MBV7317165.1 glycosyltransferase family 39 protein [Shewanella sp. NIFS-20-20]
MTPLQRAAQLEDYHKILSLLFLFAAVLIFSGIGLRSPWPADEPRFVEVAREMVQSGQWQFPLRGGEAYPDKPPVFMWAIALFYQVTDNLKVSFLLPNALCGLLTLLLVFDLGSRIWNVKVGRNAALLLLIAPQFLIQAKNAQIDAMVMCWITLGCYGLLRHFITGPHWRWYFASWGFMGLGVITKGVGFLPALMMLPILALAWREKHNFNGALKWKALAGPLVMLAVIAAWLVPMLLAVEASQTSEFINYRNNILFKQTAERYVDAWHHIKPWYYFIVSVIPVLWFPLPLLLLAYWRQCIALFKNNQPLLILMAWVLLVLAFFSISPGKRGVYILPALPMFSLIIAVVINNVSRNKVVELLIKGLVLLLSAVVLIAGILLFAEHPKLLAKLSDYSTTTLPLAWFLSLTGAVLIAQYCVLRKQPALVNWGGLTATLWLAISWFGYPLLEPMRTPQQLMQKVATTIGEDAQLGLIDFKEQFILFSPVDITHFSYLSPTSEQERNAWQWINEDERRYLLIPAGSQLACFDLMAGNNMGSAHRKDWILLSAAQAQPDCLPPKEIQRFFTPHPAQWLNN